MIFNTIESLTLNQVRGVHQCSQTSTVNDYNLSVNTVSNIRVSHFRTIFFYKKRNMVEPRRVGRVTHCNEKSHRTNAVRTLSGDVSLADRGVLCRITAYLRPHHIPHRECSHEHRSQNIVIGWRNWIENLSFRFVLSGRLELVESSYRPNIPISS